MLSVCSVQGKSCQFLVFEVKLLKVTPDLHGCPPVSSEKKNSYVHHFGGKHGKLFIVGMLNKFRFWKKNLN